MEFLALAALVALLFMVGGLRSRMTELGTTLRSLDDRLADIARRAGLPAEPRAVAETPSAPVHILDPEPAPSSPVAEAIPPSQPVDAQTAIQPSLRQQHEDAPAPSMAATGVVSEFRL